MVMVMMHVECGDLRRRDENERRVALFEEKAAPLLSHEPHPPTHAAVQLWASCSLVFCLVGWVNLCRFCHLLSPLERVVLFKRSELQLCERLSLLFALTLVLCSDPFKTMHCRLAVRANPQFALFSFELTLSEEHTFHGTCRLARWHSQCHLTCLRRG